jgi:hypothetical protein
MALKKEQTEIKYSEMIGVNRGSGFSALADASLTQANALNNLTSQFADQGLKELQKYGKKVGEDAAENAKFSKKEITYINPITNETETQYIDGKIPEFKATTKSMQEAYDKNIYDKYQKEVQSTIRDIILEERANTIKSIKTNQGGNADTFQQTIDARIAPILENLEPKFSQVIETYAKSESQSHWYQVFDERTRQDIKIGNLTYDVDLKEKLQNVETAFINGADNTQELEDDLKSFIETKKNAGVDKAIANGDTILQTIKDSKKLYAMLNEIRISDLDAASGIQIKNSKEDYSKIELLLRGGTESVTLSTGKTITKAQMLADANGNQTVLDNARIRVTGIITSLNSIYTANAKSNKELGFLTMNNDNAPKGVGAYWGDTSDKGKREAVDSISGQNYLINQYKKLRPEAVEFDNESIIASTDYAKFLIRTQGTLSTYWYNRINDSFTTMNQNALEQLNDSSILSAITSGVMNFKNPDGTYSTMEVNNVKLLGFNNETTGKLHMLQKVLTYKPNMQEAVADVVAHYDKFEQEGGQSLSQAVSWASGKKYQVSDIDKQIAVHMEKLLDVKKEVHRDIVSNGMPLRQLTDVDTMTKSALAYVLNGDTGYGYSKKTFSNFINLKLDEGDYGKQQHFVLHPVEKYYALPLEDEDTKGDWMTDIVMDKVQNSREFDEFLKDFRPKDLQFGTNIKLQTAGFEVPPKYYVVYVDNDGNPNILEDKSGFPMIYDPAPDYQKLITEQIDSPEFKDQQILLQEERIDTLNKEILMKTGTKRRKERRENPIVKEDKPKEDTAFSYLDVEEKDLVGTNEDKEEKKSNQATKLRKERRENRE